MRIKEIKIGTYNDWKEFNPEIALKILEKNNSINVNYDGWYEFVIDNFIDRAKKIGFDIDDDEVQFSGFYSQGDGASFTGTINLLTYLKNTKQLTVYRPLVRAINCGYIEDMTSITRDSHHYSHSNTCSVCDIEIYEDITTKVQSLLAELEAELEEKRQDLCSELYSSLEKTNDYLCSEESISETLAANEYEFDDQGNMA